MEKKEYKEPTVKVIEVEDTCFGEMSKGDDNRDDAVAKRGSLNFNTDFDTED